MGSYGKLQATQRISLKPESTAEDSYWNSFGQLGEYESYGGVSCVESCPTSPHEFLITSGAKIAIYDTNEAEVRRQVAFLQAPVLSAKYRGDGKLLVIGAEIPNVLIYTNKGERLRILKGHTDTVRTVGFAPDNTHIFSGSHDKTIRYWDVAGGEQIAQLTGHTDNVKTGMFNPSSSNIIVTGGYDHQVLVWDVRSGTCVRKMNQGVPVEDLTVLPDGSSVVAAGMNSFKVWDLVAGGTLRHTQSNHQKTISSISYNPTHNRLITGGLDHLVKIYDLPSYNVLHTFSFAQPVLSCCVSVDGDLLGAGQTDRFTAKGRAKLDLNNINVNNNEKQKNINRGSMRYFLRTLTETSDTIVVQNRTKRQKIRPYDRKLRSFQYGQALDIVLNTENLSVVMPLIQELRNRDGLRVALSGRDETTLTPILTFINRNITKQLHTPLLLHVLDIILDIYGPVIEHGTGIALQLSKIRNQISLELQFQDSFMPLLGSLELVVNAAIATMPIEVSTPSGNCNKKNNNK